jgi:hypothetical protein
MIPFATNNKLKFFETPNDHPVEKAAEALAKALNKVSIGAENKVSSIFDVYLAQELARMDTDPFYFKRGLTSEPAFELSSPPNIKLERRAAKTAQSRLTAQERASHTTTTRKAPPNIKKAYKNRAARKAELLSFYPSYDTPKAARLKSVARSILFKPAPTAAPKQ